MQRSTNAHQWSFIWIVASTPDGYQVAFVALGSEPGPEPGGHQPQSAVDHTAPPGPVDGCPPSVPHQRTPFGEVPPPPLNATAAAALGRVFSSALTASHIEPQPLTMEWGRGGGV